MPIPVTEDDAVVDTAPDDDPALQFSLRLAEAEAAVLATTPAGRCCAIRCCTGRTTPDHRSGP